MTQMRSSVKGFRQVRKRQPRFQPWRVSLCSRRGGWNSYLVSYLVSLSQPGRVNTWRLSFHNCSGVTEKAESHVGLPDIKGNGICFWKALCSHNGCLLLCLCGPRKAHLTFAHHSETTICKGAARYLLTQLPGQSLVEKQVLDCWVGWRTFLKKKKKNLRCKQASLCSSLVTKLLLSPSYSVGHILGQVEECPVHLSGRSSSARSMNGRWK